METKDSEPQRPLALSNNRKFMKIQKESGLVMRVAVGLKGLDEASKSTWKSCARTTERDGRWTHVWNPRSKE